MSILNIIKKHLNKLKEAETYGITPLEFKRLDPDLRDKLSLVTKPIKLSAKQWNFVLRSTNLIRFLNETELSEENVGVVKRILNTTRTLEEIENACRSGNVTIQKWRDYSVIFSNHTNTSNYYQSKVYESELERHFFVDTINYISHYGLTWDEIVVNSIASIVTPLMRNGDELENYNRLGYVEKMNFIEFRLKYSYSKYLYNAIDHFKSASKHFDLFEMLHTVCDELSHTTFLMILENMRRCIRQSVQPEQVENWLFEILKHENAADWLNTLMGSSSDESIDEFELRKLAETPIDDSRSVYSVIYGSDSAMAELLSCSQASYNTAARKQVKKWFKEKKKAILRVFATDSYLFMGSNEKTILFSDYFQNIINVNTLNEKNVKELIQVYRQDYLKERLLEDVPLTYNEFNYLYNESDEMNRKVFYSLINQGLPIDVRLRTIKELPKLSEFKEILSEEDIVQKVSTLLLQKTLKQWVEKHPINLLPQVTNKHKLFILLMPELYEKFKKDIRLLTDIDFMIRNFEIIKVASDLNQAKVLFMKRNEEALDLFKKLDLSEDFINMYKNNIIYFLDRNLGEVYLTLSQSSKLTDEQKNNLRLITKAELAGKLDEIKFVDEDFELEIGLPLSEIQKSEWKNNKKLKVANVKNMMVKETYDYETTIRIGENPVTSCLSWRNGQYSRCLLSLFDTNKKILVVTDIKGRIMARAALRLTKGSTDKRVYEMEKSTNVKNLGFKDVEGDTVQFTKMDKVQVQEDLVLFLENVYSPLNYEELHHVKKAFIELAEQKAKELGAKLVMSSDYASIVSSEKYENEGYHVFVSYSKNGYQYLDSLTGQASEALEGSYRTAYVLFEKIDKQEVKQTEEREILLSS